MRMKDASRFADAHQEPCLTETHQRVTAESGAEIVRRNQLARRIKAATTRARAVLLWEALWPCLIWPLGVCFAFIAVSWLGLWLALSDMPRIFGLVLFGVGFLASLWQARHFTRPTHTAVLTRIETASALEGRPLATLADTLPDTTDAATAALWRAHRHRQEARLGTLRVGLPDAGIDRADRYGLRLMVALMLFVGYFAAGDARWDRLGSAFRSISNAPTIAARLDVWVAPPEYTGLPALLLTGDKPPAAEPDGRYRVPQDSTVTVRTTPLAGDAAPNVVLTAGTGKPATLAPKSQGNASPDSQHAGPVEFETKLTVASDLTVSRNARELGHWRFAIVPDQPPTIRFVGLPEAQASGTLKLTYDLTDDYGVVSADAHFDPIADPSAAAVTGATKPHPLVPPPDFNLSLPSGHPKSGQSTVFHDLTAHPWAGGPVHLTLVAHDDLGQEGRSETLDVTLPARNFSKPLARALVEQRRALALDTANRQHVEDAIDALLIAPEAFYPTSGLFLSVTEIRRALHAARTDDDLKGVVDLIWQVATGIEDGNLSEAQKAVRDAEEALRNALDRGASQEEIAKLTRDLREAMNRLMNELAEAQRRAPGLKRPMSHNQKVLREQDLRRMLDRIENLAKTGSRDAARQMLSEMQRMLENLQQGNAGDQGDQQQNEANELLDQLGDMIQRQQQLMDKTHRLDRNGDELPNPDGPNSGKPDAGEPQPMSPEEMQQALRDLQQNQNALRKSLRDLEDKLAQQGLGKRPGGNKPGQAPGTNGQPAPGQGGPGDQGSGGPFGPAGNAMDDAGKSLGDGDAGNAVDAQGRAIDALRDGAKQLLDQMAQQQPGRQGPGGQAGESGIPGDDPLGRPRRNSGPQDTSSVKVPDEIDTQRARQVLEEIRRRLGEPLRPSLELDYLRRLLEGQ
jgi:uncharacterized protein (TIGR02302 family)